MDGDALMKELARVRDGAPDLLQQLTADAPAVAEKRPTVTRRPRFDFRQQDRQQERADHRDKRDGDRRDQQQKGLAEAGLCHEAAGAARPRRFERRTRHSMRRPL
jgi:hypothetical protein